MSEKSEALEAWEALFRAQVTVLRLLNTEMPDELSLNEYDVLFNLSRQEGNRLRLRDLTRHLFLTQPSVSRLVGRLAERGLVCKEADPGDGRGTVVCMTAEGAETFRRVAVVHAESIRKYVGGALDADEMRQLQQLTDKLRLAVTGAR